MEGKSVLGYAGILLLGFGLGWGLKPDSRQGDATVQQSRDAQTPPPLSRPQISTPTDTATTVDDAEPVSVEPDVDGEIAALVELIRSKENRQALAVHEWKIDDLLNYLGTASNEDYYSSHELFSLFSSNPELADGLMDNYLNISDPATKERAKQLLRSTYPGENFQIEEKIIARMKLGDPPDDWLDLLGDAGVYTNNSLNYLGEQLGYYLEGQQVTDAINAINKGADTYFNQIPRNTRESLTAQIENRLTSSDPQIKGAALRALAAFPVPESEAIIVAALSDPSNLVQRSAISSLMRGEFQDPSVSDALLSMMKDDSNAFETRVLATRALRRYNLEGQDYDDLYDFSLEIKAHEKNRQRSHSEGHIHLQ